MISVLFMGVDGATDSVIEGHAHTDGAAHQLDGGESAQPDKNSDTEGDSDHCDRCCHGHTAGITALVAAIKTSIGASDRKPRRSAHVRNFAQAPPTPPPNA